MLVQGGLFLVVAPQGVMEEVVQLHHLVLVVLEEVLLKLEQVVLVEE
jgi:hypothetical protein